MRRRFQRARKPEEKELRRQAVLEAARELLSEVAASELSLSELARRSGISKPNLYRYFESREEVLLQVWVEEVRLLSEALAASFATVKPGNSDGIAQAVVEAFDAQPMLCELTALIAPVLERNLSAKAIVSAKTTLARLTLHIAELMHARLPAISLQDCAWLSGAAATWVAGIWPSIHPPPAALEALAQPGLETQQPVFDRDFKRLLTVLFAGLARR